MHNVMVEARIKASEAEGALFYTILKSELTAERETDGASEDVIVLDYGVGGLILRIPRTWLPNMKWFSVGAEMIVQ
jgi:hypothetical protein